MTTTPGYTVEALLQAIAQFRIEYNPVLGDVILARAAELTQVTAQSVERASPAKDGGEQPTHWRYHSPFNDDCNPWIAFADEKPDARFTLDYGFTLPQPLASQMPAADDPQAIWKKVHEGMRPQSAVQGWQPIETAPKDGIPIILGWPKMALGGYWAEWRGTWTTAHGEYVGENEPTHWMPLPDAPQPPQGE